MPVYQGLTLREFKSEMQEAGYPVLSSEHTGQSVHLMTAWHGGSKFLIVLPEADGKLIIAQFIKLFDDKPSLESVNRYNYDKRWPRVFLDEEGELTLDMVFTLFGINSSYIINMFTLWEVAVQSVIDYEHFT